MKIVLPRNHVSHQNGLINLLLGLYRGPKHLVAGLSCARHVDRRQQGINISSRRFVHNAASIHTHGIRSWSQALFMS